MLLLMTTKVNYCRVSNFKGQRFSKPRVCPQLLLLHLLLNLVSLWIQPYLLAPPYEGRPWQQGVKVMLHETSRNNNFYCNSELRHCFEWFQHCSSIARLCCAKNRRCKSFRVKSPLLLAARDVPRSLLLRAFLKEERLRLRDRNSILMT